MTDRFNVIVVGLGPVGSLLTALLARQGLRVAAIERDAEVYTLPRAVNLDGEIVRGLQPYGMAEALAELLQTTRPGDRAGFVDSQHNWLFGQDLNRSGPSGWQSVNMFHQPEVEQLLRDAALNQANVTAFIGSAAGRVEQDETGVSLQVTNGDGNTAVTGDYLVACDGASSGVRKSLGIDWVNLGYDQDWLVVDVATRPGHTLGNTTMQVCAPERITTYVCAKDPYRRWEFRLNPGERWDDMLKPATIQRLIEPWTPAGTYEVIRAAMYQFHAATAATWQVGRTLIAGDAAHQTPPFLGQGMNAGMRDALNLSWKLPLVLNGTASSALLQTYETERKAHAHDLVDWAVAVGRLMEHLAAVEAAQAAAETPPETPADMRAAGYGQGREAPPLRDGVLLAHQVRQDGLTGYLYNQPTVLWRQAEHRLDDLLGAGFALVLRDGDAATLTSAAAQLVKRLGIQIVSRDDFEVTRGRLSGEDFEAVLVRPDRYIFGHTDAQYTPSALVEALAAKLHLQTNG